LADKSRVKACACSRCTQRGNFIEATPETPYFQVGESKYGKPVLDRVITPEHPAG
jgi:predicted proteasome-type protease